MECVLHQVIWFDLLHQVKAKLYPPPKEEDFLWRVKVIPHLSYIATIHSQKLIMKLFPPFTKLIFYHHIITFPPRKIPTIVTQVFGSIDSRQSPSIDSKLQWGNQAVHQIQLQKAVSQRGRGIFSIFYSILHILPRVESICFQDWCNDHRPSSNDIHGSQVPEIVKKKTLAPRYLLWNPDNVVKFLQMAGSKITNY